MNEQNIGRQSSIILFVIIAISMAIRIIVTNEIVIKLFNIQIKNEDKKNNKLKLFLFQFIGIMISKIIIPKGYYKIIDILIVMISYIIFLNMSHEKSVVAETMNFILLCITETVLAKIFLMIYSISSLPIQANDIIYKASISITSIFFKILLYKIIKKHNIIIDIEDCIECSEKIKIILISICSMILIEVTDFELVKNINIISNSLYFTINGLLIAYFAIVTSNITKISKLDKTCKEIECLEGSNERLQSNYDDIRSFRHDFFNIIQSMGGYIVTKDFEGLEKMYKSINKECQDINNKQGINKDVISDPGLYNLINNKYKKAELNEIKMKIEVLIDIEKLNINMYDLCRMLGILLDNAIEAAKDCEEKMISIKFIKDKLNNRYLIIVENPCKNYLMDVKKIFEKGITSKKDSFCHGLGLWRVKQILRKNKNIQIYTARDELFKQQIEIY